MKVLFLLATVVALSAGSSAVAATAEIKDDAINWLQDVEQAKAVAAKSAKPIFIVFLRQDPVRALTAEFLKDAVVQKALAEIGRAHV